MQIVRAAVDAVIPAVDGQPGAADLDVQRHVVEAIDGFLPGFVDLLTTLLDAYAADVRSGASFLELNPDERRGVLRLMSLEENPDMRDVIDGLLVFTYGGMYSEWTGYDRATGALTAPAVWESIGFLGPAKGHPDRREDL